MFNSKRRLAVILLAVFFAGVLVGVGFTLLGQLIFPYRIVPVQKETLGQLIFPYRIVLPAHVSKTGTP